MIKRFGLLLLQLLVTAAGIYYVLHDSARRAEVLDALRRADWHWLLLAWASYSLVETLATIRWQMLLRVQSVIVAWWRTGAIVMIGLFFNMFLPGLVGGDAMRLYCVFKEAPRQKMRAALSVAIDRLIGLVSLLLLVTLVVLNRFEWLKHSPQTLHITYIALALLGGSAAFPRPPRERGRLGLARSTAREIPTTLHDFGVGQSYSSLCCTTVDLSGGGWPDDPFPPLLLSHLLLCDALAACRFREDRRAL